MATSNLALACLAVGTAALIYGFEWLLTIRKRIQLRPQSQAANQSVEKRHRGHFSSSPSVELSSARLAK